MTSNVVCDYSDASWELNSRGQTACTVYAQLQGICDPNFVINPVNANSTAYTPPDNSCGCNIVAYNLMAGCGWCQSTIQIPWWLTVDQWRGNCTTATYNSVSISPNIDASSLTIPDWARALPTASTWSPAQASLIAVASLSSTTGRSSSTARATSTRVFPTGPTQDYGQGAAAGGKAAVVAVVVIFALYAAAGLAVVGIYFLRQKKRIAWYQPMAEFYRQQKSGGFGFNNPAAPLMQNTNPSEYFPPQNMGGQYGQPQQPWAAPPGVPSQTPSTSTPPVSYPYTINAYAPPPPEHQASSYNGNGTASTSHSSAHGHTNGANLNTNSNPFMTPGASSSTMNVAVGGSAHTVAQYPPSSYPQNQNQSYSHGYAPPPLGAAVVSSSTGSSTGGANTMSVYSGVASSTGGGGGSNTMSMYSTSTTPYGGVASVYGAPANTHTYAGNGAGPGAYGVPSGPSQYTNVNGGYSGRPEAH